jgi:hypothetical protein
MTITRTICSASLLALAAIVGPVAPGYAGEPCCDWVYGKYINLKTGKEVKPPKGAVAPGSGESAASAANRYCAKPAEATAPLECSFSSMKRLPRELKGKGRELLQILISRDFETGEPRKALGGFRAGHAECINVEGCSLKCLGTLASLASKGMEAK